MPLYLIDRDISSFDENDLEGAALRALACTYSFQGMRWVRSFLNEETGASFCIYEAESAEDLREHAVLANLPCDEVREVTEIEPQRFEADAPATEAETSGPLTDSPAVPSEGSVPVD